METGERRAENVFNRYRVTGAQISLEADRIVGRICNAKENSNTEKESSLLGLFSNLECSFLYIFFTLILRNRNHTAGAWLPMAYPITSWLLFGSASTSPRTCEIGNKDRAGEGEV